MTAPTPIPSALRLKTYAALERLPYRTGTPGTGPGNLSTVEDLLDYLARYTQHATREVAAVEARARDGARAAVVLRGLRSSLTNAASVLDELDAVANRPDSAAVRQPWEV